MIIPILRLQKLRLKKLRYLSNQDLTAEIRFLCLSSGSNAGLLSTLAYSHLCCTACILITPPCHLGCLLNSTESHPACNSREKLPHLCLETFHHHPSPWQTASISAAHTWHSHSQPCMLMSSIPSCYTWKFLESGNLPYISLYFSLSLQSLTI